MSSSVTKRRDPDFQPAKRIQDKYAIARGTLRNWANSGRIGVLRANGEGKRLYCVSDIERVLGVEAPAEQPRRPACYARVNSARQCPDLERQIAFLRQHYPTHEIYSDIGSGLNFKRPRLVALLDAVRNGAISEVVVTDKDRLCRVGIELVQWVLEKSSVQLVVHSEDVRPDNPTEPDLNHDELSDDIISIITFFTARHNGQRSARNRKRRRDDAFPIEEAEKEEGEKDEDEGEEKEERPAPKRPRIVVRASEGKEEKSGQN